MYCRLDIIREPRREYRKAGHYVAINIPKPYYMSTPEHGHLPVNMSLDSFISLLNPGSSGVSGNKSKLKFLRLTSFSKAFTGY